MTSIIQVVPSAFRFEKMSEGAKSQAFSSWGDRPLVIDDSDHIAYYLSQQGIWFDPFAGRCVMSWLTSKARAKGDRYAMFSGRQRFSHWALLVMEFMKLEPFQISVFSLSDLGFSDLSSTEYIDLRIGDVDRVAQNMGLIPCPVQLAGALIFSGIKLVHGAHISIMSEPFESEGGMHRFAYSGGKDKTFVTSEWAVSSTRVIECPESQPLVFLTKGGRITMDDPQRRGFIYCVPKSANIPSALPASVAGGTFLNCTQGVFLENNAVREGVNVIKSRSSLAVC